MENLAIQNLFSVKGKIAVVTGGGSGLGEMMATALVKNGARVLIASRKEPQLKEVSERLTKMGPGSCEYIIGNIINRAGCDALVAEIKKRTDKVHILVNNSGTTFGAPFEDFPEEQGWDRVLGTNVKAIYYMTAGLSGLLSKNATALDPGRVVSISSVAGLSPNAESSLLGSPGAGLWSYNTSKAAANHLTSQLAVTLGPKFITSNAICPGVFPSKMTAFGLAQAADALAASHPMGRIGTPEDITGLLLFLVSRAGAHVTGAHIAIDGGSLIAGRGYTKSNL